METQLANGPWIDLVGRAADQAELLTLMDTCDFDVAILGCPADSVRQIDKEGSALRGLLDMAGVGKAVVFADLAHRDEVQALLDIGVTNLVSSHDEVDQLVHAVLMARLGMHSLSQAVSELLWGAWRTSRESAEPWIGRLTDRELKVLRMYLAGMPVSEIARETGRNVTTISTQKKSVMRKMQVSNDVQLAVFSIQHGLL